MPFPIKGIFTSHWSSDPPAAPIDWPQLRRSGYSYAYLKATDWINYKAWQDPAFERDWYEAQSAGFLVGALHYFRPDVDPRRQADHLLTVLDRLGFGQLPPDLDLEERPPAGIDLFSAAFEYLNVIALEVDCRPALYTSPGFWEPFARPIRDSFRFLFHVAHWTRIRSSPLIPDFFPGWHFWQHLEHVNRPFCPSAPGITGPACPDRFNGSYQDLLELCLPSPPPPNTFPIRVTSPERQALLAIAERLR